MRRQVDILKKKITNAKKIVFFTGAGVSTSSGYPDLIGMEEIIKTESNGSLSLLQVFTNRFAQNNPKLFYDLYRKTHFRPLANPSSVHRGIATLEKRYPIEVVTMNLDYLHTLVGSSSVVELWGSINDNQCIHCHNTYDREFIVQNAVPYCLNCQHLVLPIFVIRNMVGFKKAIEDSNNRIKNSDLLIVCGTMIAHDLPKYSGEMVILNQTPTRYDSKATLVIHEDLVEVFKLLV